MRNGSLIFIAWLGSSALAQTTHTQPDPIASSPAPSQQVTSAEALNRRSEPSPARNLHTRIPVELAALGSPDLSLLPSMMVTEEEALKSLEQELSLKVGKNFRSGDYPEEAIRHRWSGTTLVQVQVGSDGMVTDVSLQRTSGFRVLDERALVVVRRVSKLFVPFRLRGREHSVTVPVGFYLKDV